MISWSSSSNTFGEFQPLVPFRFNPWKHHRQWVCQQIEMLNKDKDSKTFEAVLDYIKSINSNHVDVYTGMLMPEEIVYHLALELEKLKITDKQHFINWVGKSSYRLIRLSDLSVWVIREGKEDERYIHFHPARNSPNAARIHGNSWKTAIALKLLNKSFLNFSLMEINEIRKDYINLSPIKNLEGNMRLRNAICLLHND